MYVSSKGFKVDKILLVYRPLEVVFTVARYITIYTMQWCIFVEWMEVGVDLISISFVRINNSLDGDKYLSPTWLCNQTLLR